jgi:hypothetical protein
MSENETAGAEVAPEQNGAEQSSPTTTDSQAATEAPEAPEAATEAPVVAEEITYHAVEKDGQVTAIWEMQGRKHLRTIDPRSRQGQDILRLYTSEHHDDQGTQGETASS